MKWRLRLLYDFPSDFNAFTAYRPVLGAFVIVSTFLLTPTATAYAADATRLVTAEAKRQGVPVAFALRVARVESGVQCGKIGKAGERGPVQILPRTAAALGYHGIDKSACARQTAAGIRHLAICLQKGRSLHRAAACHNGGFGMLGRRNWPKSVRRYVSKVVPQNASK